MRDLFVGAVVGFFVGGILLVAFYPAFGIAMMAAPIIGYLIVLALAKNNILLTTVESGWCKIVMEWGEFSRILSPGLHWVGIPGVCALYKRKMTFYKSVTEKDGTAIAEPHGDAVEGPAKEKEVDSFKTTRYPYAFPFKDEEDNKGLPLFGVLAASGVVEDYRKAFFDVSDWYAEVITRILACFSRKVLIFFSYDDDIVGRDKKKEEAKKVISEFLWEKLNLREDGNPSIVEELLEVVGFRLFSIELRSVDPPPGWRDITLAPYKAEREKEAAKLQAEASAALFDDTNQALKTWLVDQRAAGEHPTRTQIEAKQEELRQRALAKTPGYQQVHIKGLENASTAVVGGGGAGGAGIIVGNSGSRNSGAKNPGNSGSNQPAGQANKPTGGGGRSLGKADFERAKRVADEYFAKFGEYPPNDPLGRGNKSN